MLDDASETVSPFAGSAAPVGAQRWSGKAGSPKAAHSVAAAPEVSSSLNSKLVEYALGNVKPEKKPVHSRRRSHKTAPGEWGQDAHKYDRGQ